LLKVDGHIWPSSGLKSKLHAFAEEHCFGCASALRDCVDEYYSSANKTFTTTVGFRWKADYPKTLL